MKNSKNYKFALLVLIALFIAFFMGRISAPDQTDSHTSHVASEHIESWTCSMHPQIKMPDPGQCPICFMDLIPAGNARPDGDIPELTLSPAAMALAEIQTAVAFRGPGEKTLRLSGKVVADETRIKVVTARVAGRLEKLYVDYTGMDVQAGDHLVEIYSPELITAANELVQSNEYSSEKMTYKQPQDILNITSRAAQEKLRLLGLTAEQIDQLTSAAELPELLTIYSPVSGIVTQRHISQGQYVQPGSPLFEITDLSRVWVNLDIYEQDLPFVQYGQSVRLTLEALPGDTLIGLISLLQPVLNIHTRIVEARIILDNSQGLLKPGMFADGEVSAFIDAGGHSIPPDLSGKWISPMHPEIVKDGPGICDVCGMPLVPAEELGYTHHGYEFGDPLLIPVTAVLRTGERALVYVQHPDRAEPTFSPREIQVGLRAGNFIIVLSGLEEGERVVKHGNFKIDSAIQITGATSLMSPQAPAESPLHPGMGSRNRWPTPINVEPSLWPTILSDYLVLQKELARDNYADARAAFDRILLTINDVASDIHAISDEISDIITLRNEFENVSRLLLLAAEQGFLEHPVYEAFCPMAFDFQGAYWLQNHDTIDNPYFGASMLRCGEIKRRFENHDAAGENHTPANKHEH